MIEEYMTLKEAQEYLCVSKAKMSRLAKSLEIYEDPRDKRKRLVKKADIEPLLQPRPRTLFDNDISR
jgi:tmRNA-binding protein